MDVIYHEVRFQYLEEIWTANGTWSWRMSEKLCTAGLIHPKGEYKSDKKEALLPTSAQGTSLVISCHTISVVFLFNGSFEKTRMEYLGGLC